MIEDEWEYIFFSLISAGFCRFLPVFAGFDELILLRGQLSFFVFSMMKSYSE